MFKILKKDLSSWARTGVIETPHGMIETPAYTVVGTHGQIRCLPPELFLAVKLQVVIANTYHLWLASPASPRRVEAGLEQERGEQASSIDHLPKVHDLLGANLPMMTDSGGFQVFSLGFSREHGVGKVKNIFSESYVPSLEKAPEKNLVRITEEGAFFTVNNQEQFLGPELSIKIQEKLGADIIMAFDECTSPLHSFEYNREAMERTHRWAKVCLETKTSHQLLYGIVQGGEFKDLRQCSAKFMASLPFDGLAIGGSFGKSADGAFKVLEWTIPFLGEDRPRHFLGIGQIGDLFEGVERGVDTFDCVIPTREARHGRIWTAQGPYDITKAIHKISAAPLEIDCLCPTCLKITRADLHRFFKAKDQLAGQYATAHNVYFFNSLMENIRQSILNNRLMEFKKSFLAKIKSR